jgi:LuxR family maltose regulon positive regulatory protein
MNPAFAICAAGQDGRPGCIAALAIKSGIPRHDDVGFTLTGDDVYMGDYLRSELLDRISRAEASFLTRTSVLDRMCGPLCDAILDAKGSTAVREQMEARNLLLIPLDRHREWYRYHHLLRDLLRSELRRREPALVDDLHVLAAAVRANDMPRLRSVTPGGGRLRPRPG